MIDRRSFLKRASVVMAHAAFPQALAAFLAGCSAKRARAPVFFSAEEMRMLGMLVDLILPATDSPAASAADTQWFIDLALDACATTTQKASMRSGLRALDAGGFSRLDSIAQSKLLQQRAAADVALPYDQSFFKILKDYTLTGYFHSEIGATQALAYERIPGGYQGDLPLGADQKAWAT